MFNKHFACSIAFDKQIYNWSRMKQMEAVVGEKNEINKQLDNSKLGSTEQQKIF